MGFSKFSWRSLCFPPSFPTAFLMFSFLGWLLGFYPDSKPMLQIYFKSHPDQLSYFRTMIQVPMSIPWMFPKPSWFLSSFILGSYSDSFLIPSQIPFQKVFKGSMRFLLVPWKKLPIVPSSVPWKSHHIWVLPSFVIWAWKRDRSFVLTEKNRTAEQDRELDNPNRQIYSGWNPW